MRDALSLALQEYGGAMVLVSHDRSLIRSTADELWLVADGAAQLFDGDLDDYRLWIEARRPRESVKAPTEKPKREPAVKKKALVSKKDKIEAEMAACQDKLSEANRQLADPVLYANPADPRIAELNREREAQEARIAALEESWLELEMALEEAGG
jgi:ATP-binding cassette subfamily F protein 3